MQVYIVFYGSLSFCIPGRKESISKGKAPKGFTPDEMVMIRAQQTHSTAHP
jgi:hypothetical protein